MCVQGQIYKWPIWPWLTRTEIVKYKKKQLYNTVKGNKEETGKKEHKNTKKTANWEKGQGSTRKVAEMG